MLSEVLERYDGPVLVERLAHLALRNDDATAHAAAYEALKHLHQTGQFSPHIEQLLNKASKMTPQDDQAAVILMACCDPNWITSLQNNKAAMLKELNADNLYHERDVSVNIRVATIYMYNRLYSDANNALATSTVSAQTCQLAEYSAQVGILQGNNLHVASQEKRIQGFLSTSLSNEAYTKRLTEEELTSYWRTRFLILFSLFLKQSFDDVAKEAYALVNADPIMTVDKKPIYAIDVFNTSDFKKFIHKDEITLAVMISVLLSRPSDELSEVVGEKEFVKLMGSSIPDVRELVTALTNANYRKVFEVLEELSPMAEESLLLNKVWSDVKLKFRRKGYMLYLSLVQRVTIDHLARKLNIESSRLLREFKELIRDENLEFEITEDDKILQAVKTDKKVSYHDRLEKLSEQADNVEHTLSLRIEQEKMQDRKTPPPGARSPKQITGAGPSILGTMSVTREFTKTPPGDESRSNVEGME